MSTIAIGDIHGNAPAVIDLLNRLRATVTTKDVVVFLGDYIDRGLDSKGCIDAILEFQRDVDASVVCLRGNHEDWMLRTARDYSHHSWLLGMEAMDTIRSYSPEAAQALRDAMSAAGVRLYVESCELPYHVFFDTMPPAHRRFFDELQLCHETRHCICSHAGLNPGLPIDKQTVRDLVWGHAEFPAKYLTGPPVVYGHKPCRDVDEEGWPKLRVTGQTFGIDTIGQGILSALRLPENEVIRSACHLL